jgi:hypothetical protein
MCPHRARAGTLARHSSHTTLAAAARPLVVPPCVLAEGDRGAAWAGIALTVRAVTRQKDPIVATSAEGRERMAED